MVSIFDKLNKYTLINFQYINNIRSVVLLTVYSKFKRVETKWKANTSNKFAQFKLLKNINDQACCTILIWLYCCWCLVSIVSCPPSASVASQTTVACKEICV